MLARGSAAGIRLLAVAVAGTAAVGALQVSHPVVHGLRVEDGLHHAAQDDCNVDALCPELEAHHLCGYRAVARKGSPTSEPASLLEQHMWKGLVPHVEA